MRRIWTGIGDTGPPKPGQRDIVGTLSHCSRNLSSIREAGMYVSVLVNGLSTYLLVDTGATASLLSRTIFDVMTKTNNTVSEVEGDVLSANGTPLQVLGRTNVELKFADKAWVQNVIVAELNVDGILGMDFLVENQCIINLQTHALSISGMDHPIRMEGTARTYKVAVVNRISLQPMSETIVEGTLCPAEDGGLPFKAGIVEPTEKFLRSDYALLAKTLVRSQQTIPLRIMNTTTSVRTINPGTVIGKFSPVEEMMSAGGDDADRTEPSEDLPEHLKDLYDRCTVNLTEGNKMKAKQLLIKYSRLFSATDEDVGRTNIVKHKINTGTHDPVKQPPRRLPVSMQEEVKGHIADMLQRGVIEPSTSPWSSAIVLVKKKDGSTRFCIDYRRLNSATVKDAYPLPRIDESLDQLRGARWFSTLDLNAGYWQVEMDPADRPKTAFATREGLYEFNVMPFGLCNAPATFERLMETVLSGLQWQICLIYLDDIIVYGRTFEEMLRNLEMVFKKLLAAGLKLKARKCSLFAKQVKYLGHVISENGIETDPEKIEAIRTWPQPMNKTQVRSFLGLCSYYRKFIRNFADIARPLHKITEHTKVFDWTDECEDSFKTLKTKLTETPILTHPDFSLPFILDTDASHQAVGAVLSQVQDGNEKVVAYASKALSNSERKYCVTRKELLAVVTFIKHFRHFLYGHKFVVRTDHSSLRWLLRFKDPEGQLARWLEVISAYDMEIEHRAGRLHGNADGLSRKPCGQCGFFDGWEMAESSPQHSRIVEAKKSDEETKFAGIQDQDRDISMVKSWVQDGNRPEYSDISAESYAVKSLWSQWSRLAIKDDLLCRMWEEEGSKTITYQVIAPLTERRTILEHVHDSKTAGHLGVSKTLNKIRQGYYWPGLQSDVRSYVAGCQTCSKRKSPTKTKKAPMQTLQIGYPMERIATDILGEFPETENRNRYILVISDYYTKVDRGFPHAEHGGRNSGSHNS